MATHAPGTERVDDFEVLYRRIPVSTGWYSDGIVSPEAFDPRRDELTGISIYRKKYKSAADVARGKSKHGYYVASLRASDLRKHGIEPVPRPLLDSDPPDPGHAEIECLTCLNRLAGQALQHKVVLAGLCFEVQGPFPPLSV